MQDRPCPSKPRERASVSSSAARVWMTTGLPSSAASSSCRVEEAALRVVRRVVAEVVEAGLADGDGALVGEQVAQLVEPLGLGAAGFVRVDAERRVDAVVLRRRARARCAARLDASSRR